jgi:serine/threonine-protein kinase
MLERLHTDATGVVAYTMPLTIPQGSDETERMRAALRLLEASNFDKSAQAQQLRDLLNTSTARVNPNARFISAMRTHGNVVLPVEARLGNAEGSAADLPASLLLQADEAVLDSAAKATIVRPLPVPFLDAANAVGHLLLTADSDGRVRTDLTAVNVGSALVPSLALAIAGRVAAQKHEPLNFSRPLELRVGKHTLTLGAQLRMRPQYFAPGSANGFAHYAYSKVLAGKVPADQLRDKIVLIGLTDAETTVTTPLATNTSAAEAIASTLSSLLNATVYARPVLTQGVEWLAMIAVVLVAALALPALGVRFGAMVAAAIVVVLAVAEWGVLSSTRVWMQFIVACVAMLAGYALYMLSELIRTANTKASASKDPTGSLRELGQTFQRQGQLDLAFETYRRCPLDAPTMELLYFLGTDFERRRQNQKAAAVYSHIATRDPNYRDLRTRRSRVKDDPVTREPLPEMPSSRQPAPPPSRRAAPVEEAPPYPGRTLGRYEIERELGKGAMGVVYLGRDPKINRVVAIKAIPLAEEFGESDLAEARARFFREAEMAGRLNHPAIVTVYDAGEDQGLAYIAMEYLRGQHLSHYTDPTLLLPTETTIALVARTADALHYAHRQNVVHRDIKPANIMFNPDTDELKITDFGIARLTDTSRTKTGIVLGTPSFMSPEQLEGRSLDGRSDQFALGVSLYQLLCGQLPFRAESMPRLMQKIATEPHAPIRLIRPELPEAIDIILNRTLAKDADHRYATCAEFAADLRACAPAPKPAAAAAPAEHEWLIP